jgi:hypothetical protein
VYWVASFWLIAALVGFFILFGHLAARRLPDNYAVHFGGESASVRDLGRGLGVPIIGLLMLVGFGYATWCTMQTSRLTLDKQAGTYILDKGMPFFTPLVRTDSLSEIDSALLETDGGAYRFVLLMRDGSRVSLGTSFTDQGNQSESVYAVNIFLKEENGE